MQTTIFTKTRSRGRTKHLLHHLYSLRLRLMLWYLLILTATLCAFSVAIYVILENTLYEEADRNLQPIIQALAQHYNPQLANNGLSADGSITDLLNPQYADSTIAILLNPQEQIIQTLGRSDTPDLYRQLVQFNLVSNTASSHAETGFNARENMNVHFSTTRNPVIDQVAPKPWNAYAFEMVMITDPQGHILNVVLVGQNTDIPDQLNRLLFFLVIITSLALLISSVGSYWLASRATRPVQMITHMAQEIGATDLRRRLNLNQRDELGELATTFDSMLDRLERAFERQRQFTADASHELRTPLSIINTEIERLLQRPHTSQEYLQTMEIIQQENQRMSRLVNDLLTLARADQGQAPFQCEQLDLSEIVIDAAERLAGLAEQSKIEVHISNLDELFVWGNRIYLTQLCINLLENAIKYSTGIGRRVDVRLERQQGQACIQFIDEGPGIAAEHLTYLFERFYRVDQSRTHNQSTAHISIGSGLGLSIARWIAQEHSGSIQVQSSPGKGSTFEIRLPLQLCL